MNAILSHPTIDGTDQVFRDRLPGDDIRELVPNAAVILDCGAGEGGWAKNARAVWPNAEIHSFEPHSRFNAKLQRLDDNHYIHQLALGDVDGEAKLFTTHGPQSNSLLEPLPHSPLGRLLEVVGHQTVRMVRLDDFSFMERRKVDVLKLDVQGYELRVLEGAKELIARDRPVIYTEVSFQAQYKDHPLLADVDAYLAGLGYKRLYLYASPMPDIWGDAIYVHESRCLVTSIYKDWADTHPEDRPAYEERCREYEASKPIRLNIGAGDTVIDGFTPIDRKFGTEAFPLQYPDNSVEEIRCCHMLEHLPYNDVAPALREWLRVLKPGGKLRLSVPDIDRIMELRQKKDHLWRHYLMGGQQDADDFHKVIFDREYFDSVLPQLGFERLGTWESPNTDCAALPCSLNIEAYKPVDAIPEKPPTPENTIKTRAVIGMPRIGWNDSWMSITDAMRPFNIPIETHQGCFWGQNIQKAMTRALKDGIDWLITLDYDSMIMPHHVSRLLEILGQHPEIDAIASMQMRRGSETPLFSTGKTSQDVDWSPIKVNTAHFGLTILRVECLKDLAKPWLIDIPDKDGNFDGEHTDADITFWKKWTAAGHSVYVAPDVRIGHLELLVSEFDEELKPRHYHIGKWWSIHARQGHCMRSNKED